jgi:mono/diheme cytochrome c family protein
MGTIHTRSAVSALIIAAAVTLHAQPSPQGGGRGGRGGAITSRRNAYPDRPPGDPAAIERGKALYGVNCQFCHGADIRGGDGGPSLLRSAVVLSRAARACYMLDGRQHVLVAAGDTLYAFALYQ